MPSQSHFDRRRRWQGIAQQERKNTVRFGQVFHPTARPEREPVGLELVAALKRTALHYRELAQIEGRPTKRALFIQFAVQREQRAGELEDKIRGRQQPPEAGGLFPGGGEGPRP